MLKSGHSSNKKGVYVCQIYVKIFRNMKMINLLTERLEVGLNLDSVAADVVAKLLGLDVDLK